MNRDEKRVLVTGASGFIGRHCIPLLLDRGFKVHAVTSRPLRLARPLGVRWHRANLLDTDACAAVVAAVRPTYVLHLAWTAAPGVFWNSPDNLRWLAAGVELLQALGRQGSARVVAAGSCAEYESNHDRCREYSTPLRPNTVYGRCKLAMDQALAAAASVYGFSAAWARLFFPYGPGEPPGRLIPAVVKGLLEQQPVACTDGLQQRDFVYVEDAAMALVRLLDSTATGPFNIGSGEPISLREAVGAITDRLGRSDLIDFGARPRSANDPDRLVADIGRIADELGWQPQVSFPDGISRTIDDWTQRLFHGVPVAAAPSAQR